jgi:ABC-type multidrug transport system fused ATPase/permease subunit
VSDGDDAAEKKEEPRLALRNIFISIEPGEKVAICGRTGSGKSSIILLLLRLLDPLPSEDQSMTIDGLSLSAINRAVLRSRILALPQDPFFLPDGNSFQANLDPYGGATEAECEAALKEVSLRDVAESRGGLAALMNADTLSQGQRQLFSVARVLLRARARAKASGSEKSGGVLLLDEVSSSVDAHTDALIQRVLKKEFERYTVVAIAHRMDSIKDYDRVIFMENGQVKGTGSPDAMLMDQAGPVLRLDEK